MALCDAFGLRGPLVIGCGSDSFLAHWSVLRCARDAAWFCRRSLTSVERSAEVRCLAPDNPFSMCSLRLSKLMTPPLRRTSLSPEVMPIALGELIVLMRNPIRKSFCVLSKDAKPAPVPRDFAARVRSTMFHKL